MATDPNEIVEIEHPDVKATALRTRKQLEHLKAKGWRIVRGSDVAKAANAPNEEGK